MKKLGILAAILVLTVVSCSESNSNDENQSEERVIALDSDSLTQHAPLLVGFQLLESTCFACHSPNLRAENKVAPTIGEIKTNYLIA